MTPIERLREIANHAKNTGRIAVLVQTEHLDRFLAAYDARGKEIKAWRELFHRGKTQHETWCEDCGVRFDGLKLEQTNSTDSAVARVEDPHVS